MQLMLCTHDHAADLASTCKGFDRGLLLEGMRAAGSGTHAAVAAVLCSADGKAFLSVRKQTENKIPLKPRWGSLPTQG